MPTLTQFYETAHPPRSPLSDRWYLAEGEDGSLAVLHRWTRPEELSAIFRDPGERVLSVRDFLREEGSDTAKARLRALLESRAVPA
jgi:hypothetical protein